MAATDEYAPAFEIIDVDKDGYISLAEFTNLMALLGGDRTSKESVENMFGQIDTDGDGRVDLAELSTFLRATAG